MIRLLALSLLAFAGDPQVESGLELLPGNLREVEAPEGPTRRDRAAIQGVHRAFSGS